MSNARCYLVVSPECSAVDVILDDGSGPMEYWREPVFAFARNARRARVLALRVLRRQYGANASRSRPARGYHFLSPDENPFAGMTVEHVRNFTCNDAPDDHWWTTESEAAMAGDTRRGNV